MNNAEKMFMAINNVDERLIDEAKGRDEKPVLIQVEKHLPIKEIIGFAACFVILAAGIFSLMKFRINTPEPENSATDPVGSTVSDNSSQESDTSSTVSEPENSDNSEDPDISPENKELLEILTQLAANAVELNGMFTEKTELSGDKISYGLKVNEEDFDGAYYPIKDGDRTQPNSLFAMPKTKSELETMLLTTFTKRAVEYYMQRIGTGILVTDTDGSTVINEITDFGGHKTFLEIDGRLYHDMSDSIFKWYCDPKTAHVISKTDKTIRFSYSGNGDWDESTGIIVYEDGGWKLDFFGAGNGVGFIPELPTEFTEEDNELNDILNELSTAEWIRNLFHSGAFTGQNVRFKISNDPDEYGFEYSLLPKDEKKYPQSCEQVEELLLKYFTKEIADQFMGNVEKGTMTENSDGTFTITTDSGDEYFPVFLEIDGQMYVRTSERGGPAVPIWGTAQVTERTSEEIKFSMVYEMYGYYSPGKGSIKYERGGWRLNCDLSGWIGDE